jgi:hypothetical protein
MNRSSAETAILERVRGRSSERFQLDTEAISSESEAEAETPQPPSKVEGGTQNDDAAAGAGVRMRVEKPIVSFKVRLFPALAAHTPPARRSADTARVLHVPGIETGVHAVKRRQGGGGGAGGGGGGAGG